MNLSSEMLSDIARRVSKLPTETSRFSTDVDRIEATFINFDGIEKTTYYEYHELWFPSAVACANKWLKRLRSTGAANADIVATRRVLGRLVLDYGDEVTTQRTDFYRAENLIRLSQISN